MRRQCYRFLNDSIRLLNLYRENRKPCQIKYQLDMLVYLVPRKNWNTSFVRKSVFG